MFSAVRRFLHPPVLPTHLKPSQSKPGIEIGGMNAGEEFHLLSAGPSHLTIESAKG